MTDFNANLTRFVAHAQKTIEAEFAACGYGHTPKVAVDPRGTKYARLVSIGEGDRKVCYGFVDKTNGDILKAATWKAPAKHARGNVADVATYKCAGPFGIAYLR